MTALIGALIVYELVFSMLINILAFLNTGSPAVIGDKEEDVNADDIPADFHLTETQNEKQKIAQRMMSWHMTYGRGEDTSAPNYDKEGSNNHIPYLISGQEVKCLIYNASLF